MNLIGGIRFNSPVCFRASLSLHGFISTVRVLEDIAPTPTAPPQLSWISFPLLYEGLRLILFAASVRVMLGCCRHLGACSLSGRFGPCVRMGLLKGVLALKWLVFGCYGANVTSFANDNRCTHHGSPAAAQACSPSKTAPCSRWWTSLFRGRIQARCGSGADRSSTNARFFDSMKRRRHQHGVEVQQAASTWHSGHLRCTTSCPFQ